MAWLKFGVRKTNQLPLASGENSSVAKLQLQPLAEHVEHSGNSLRAYEFAPSDLPDAELPFISPGEVSAYTSNINGGLFIVIDNVVYNCAAFISEHPGGEQIIESFAGAECSWQFWRFHGRKELKEFGNALRVGRTEGMVNKYKEPPRFVGLRRLGCEWD